jgi:SOS-response transcriptional repressor LexA
MAIKILKIIQFGDFMSNLDVAIGERLRIVREQLGLKQVNFASQLGVIPQTYSKYEKGERGLSDDVKVSLYKMGISSNWLLTGKGSMFLADEETLPQTVQAKIPLLSQKVSCGHGVSWENEQNVTEYLDLNDLSPALRGRKLYGFRVKGTSMLGAGIKDGDIVIFAADQVQSLDDGIYVFSLDGDVYCKRLEFDPIASRIKIYSVRVADLEKAELLATLASTDDGFAERFNLFGRVQFWLHQNL